MSQSRIERVENGIPPISLSDNEPPLRVNLEELMKLYKVPGLSIAVIDNFEIAWAKGYGVADPGSNTPVTPRTLFQAASISKPVAAAGTLYLVEQDKLSLDENVNVKLKSWQVPENEFAKEQKVTLRRILSHSAGLTENGGDGYEVGLSIPTLVQVLDGLPPANTPPVRVDSVPGTKFHYSSGGVTIEHMLLIDVTGKPFPQFMRETVLDKIGMADSTFEQPLPLNRAALAATGTYAGGIPVRGKWHTEPEMAAGGLWTTPTDLAKFAIEIALSKQGKANRVLSEAMTREMLKPQIDQVGLGFFLAQFNNPEEFHHDGWLTGYLSYLTMCAGSGKGLVIMLNSERMRGFEKFVIRSVAEEFGWRHMPNPQCATGELLTLIANMKGPQAAIAKYIEIKSSASSPYRLYRRTLLELADYFLASQQNDAAIEVSKLEAQAFPSFWEGYHYLGKSCLNAGQKGLAIESYQRSVELNPQDLYGIKELKRLRGQE